MTTPDPLEDKYPGWSSYNYCYDNPLNFFDPNGMAGGFNDLLSEMDAIISFWKYLMNQESPSSSSDKSEDQSEEEKEKTDHHPGEEPVAKGAQIVGKAVKKAAKSADQKLVEITDKVIEQGLETVKEATEYCSLGCTIAATCDPEPILKAALYKAATAYDIVGLFADVAIVVRDRDWKSFENLSKNFGLFITGKKISKRISKIESLGKAAIHTQQLFDGWWGSFAWGIGRAFR